ncbi:hypothetical protein V8G54_001583 [Vigna mungo]|uniref:Uncharacterized protein n=1 Tax=Vigna mungo TaxID=3915 RepID=A0AAQ3P838_VIGMU
MLKNMQRGHDRGGGRTPWKIEGRDVELVAKGIPLLSCSVLHQELSPCPLLLVSHCAPLTLCTWQFRASSCASSKSWLPERNPASVSTSMQRQPPTTSTPHEKWSTPPPSRWSWPICRTLASKTPPL